MFVNNEANYIVQFRGTSDSIVGTEWEEYSLRYNTFINNTVIVSLVHLEQDTFDPLKVDKISIEHNSFINNVVTSGSTTSFIEAAICSNNINYNLFENDIMENVPYFFKFDGGNKLSINHNTFRNNKFGTSNIDAGALILSDSGYNAYIKRNIFYSDSISNNVNAYIQVNSHSTSHWATFQIQYNKFYSSDNINYFISFLAEPDNMPFQYNYFDGFHDINDITDKMYDFCDDLDAGLIQTSPWYYTDDMLLQCTITDDSYPCNAILDDVECQNGDVSTTKIPISTSLSPVETTDDFQTSSEEMNKTTTKMDPSRASEQTTESRDGNFGVLIKCIVAVLSSIITYIFL